MPIKASKETGSVKRKERVASVRKKALAVESDMIRKRTRAALKDRIVTPKTDEPHSDHDAVRCGMPPPPLMSVQFGDKTPEYVRWFHANHSQAEFEAKYSRWLDAAWEIIHPSSTSSIKINSHE